MLRCLCSAEKRGSAGMELIIKRFDELTTSELYAILQARVAVFVVEQQCIYQEIDGKDLYSHHVFYMDRGQLQAYVRVIPPEQTGGAVTIGRVLTVKRGAGRGKGVMLEGIKVARDIFGADSIHIEAQVYAKGFYEKLGFVQTSAEFLDDGIPHVQMELTL